MRLRLFDRRTRRRSIWALPMVAALIAVIPLLSATPAGAAPHTIYTEGAKGYAAPNAGSARFAEYGDHIYLCDHKEDKHSVGVYLQYARPDGPGTGHDVTEWRWHWQGPNFGSNGCKDINLEVLEGSDISYQVCLGDRAHPGGKKAKVKWETCSALKTVYNDG